MFIYLNKYTCLHIKYYSLTQPSLCSGSSCCPLHCTTLRWQITRSNGQLTKYKRFFYWSMCFILQENSKIIIKYFSSSVRQHKFLFKNGFDSIIICRCYYLIHKVRSLGKRSQYHCSKIKYTDIDHKHKLCDKMRIHQSKIYDTYTIYRKIHR